MTTRSITILGATGSIGCSTLDVVRAARRDQADAFPIHALVGSRNIDRLVEQALEFRPQLAVTAEPERFSELKSRLAGSGIDVAAGAQAVIEAADRPADWVMGAIVGAAGLPATLAAVRRGAILALANKECVVCAGALFTQAAAASGSTILPVDSEHNAIFQVLDHKDMVERLILTASGGPFRQKSLEEMHAATPAQAVAHPNWSMGAKISIDSATMMNKGLELIEATVLFAMPECEVEVLVHPQSIVHSLVAYRDGSVLAQLGAPDMRTPIAYTLAWPQRMAAPSQRLDLAKIASLTFQPPDEGRFPALRIARACARAGGIAPNVMNAANEIAVDAFLNARIRFTDIAVLVEQTIEDAVRAHPQAGRPAGSFDEVLAVDADARRRARGFVAARAAA